ncbi:K(+)-transporting ATPase subunit F [Nannocystis sp. SCPEA4]|jgi:K+-transporting ATPase KdpF subunit|nr:K(+)-transporting ATPase subunit F [Nannocystis sp. SCPEA4]MCY1059316.1 K(+)-transporting ATPase subunit F [Nannocystis sp. SCPEA4]
MTIMHWVAGLVSIGLGVYLLVALLAPEKFS